jgi:hypothetical protein
MGFELRFCFCFFFGCLSFTQTRKEVLRLGGIDSGGLCRGLALRYSNWFSLLSL